MKMTRSYREEVKKETPWLKDEWCIRAIQNPDHCERQKKDKRWRYWKYVPETKMHMRVVTLPDGEIVHNAFPDRNFKAED